MPSELKRAFSEDGPRKTHIGGQALIGGVMMRGRASWAVGLACADGSVTVEEHPLDQNRARWKNLPLVRGCVALVESLSIGFKALAIAADHSLAEDEEPEEFTSRDMALSLLLGLALALVLFVGLPAVVSQLLVGEYLADPFVWNVVDGIARVAIFVFYVWLIGRMADIKEMFRYHGAEHKAIHCFEHGLELTPDNARRFPCLHVRCGTAFLIMVIIVALLVYTIVPLDAFIAALGIAPGAPAFAALLAVRIALLPLIAGISYEISVKWAGSRPESPVVKVLLWPGLQMQRLTTGEPDDLQLSCAIAALKAVDAAERATQRD